MKAVKRYQQDDEVLVGKEDVMRIHRQTFGLFLAAFAALGLMASLSVEHSIDLSTASVALPISGGIYP